VISRMPKLITAMPTGSYEGSLNMVRVSKNYLGPRHSSIPYPNSLLCDYGATVNEANEGCHRGLWNRRGARTRLFCFPGSAKLVAAGVPSDPLAPQPRRGCTGGAFYCHQMQWGAYMREPSRFETMPSRAPPFYSMALR
jgi:hypothetical protein